MTKQHYNQGREIIKDVDQRVSRFEKKIGERFAAVDRQRKK